MDLIFSPPSADCLQRLAEDPSAEQVLDSIWDRLDLIESQGTSSEARHRSFRTVAGERVWLVKVPVLYQDERWIILWQARGDHALIAYVGPDSFRPFGK